MRTTPWPSASRHLKYVTQLQRVPWPQAPRSAVQCAASGTTQNLSGVAGVVLALSIVTAVHQPDASAQEVVAKEASAGVKVQVQPTRSTRPVDAVAEAILHEFVDNQYYVTGDLRADLFAPNCVFKDPTTTVIGVETYTAALKTLFDPTQSRADLISIKAADDNTVVLRWRLEGTLRIGGLRIKPYTGTTYYRLDQAGRVAAHEEEWDISALDAFVSTFFPSFGAPPAPPVS